MRTITKYHYINSVGKSEHSEAVTHHFTSNSEDLTDEVCLINTCFEKTGFEPVPPDVENWIENIGMDFRHFPNLTRLWGANRSIYAMTLRYEIAHEHVDKDSVEYPVILPYEKQFKQLLIAAARIAEALPYAIVRLSEQAASHQYHELEIAFP